MKLPAEAFENHLAELVAVTRRGRAMVGRAVALDAEQVSAELLTFSDLSHIKAGFGPLCDDPCHG